MGDRGGDLCRRVAPHLGPVPDRPGLRGHRGRRVLRHTAKYTFEFDTTAWGWIHLILGIVLALTGFFLFTGAAWARIVGIAVAVLAMLANFLWLPHYPFWAIVLIALDVLVIWALSTYDPELV